MQKKNIKLSGRLKNKDGTLINDHTQAAIVIIDHTTGQVVAVSGELGNNNTLGLNRAIQTKRQTGSSMKVIADIAPGLQEKVITAATIYDDKKTSFNGYPPNNYNGEKGLINIRSAVRTSQNIPMVKIMKELTPAKAIEYLEKMGITTLTEKDNTLPLAIGGLTDGISPLEMAGAYATIANDGVYITPIFYTKVVDEDGNTVLTPKQEKTRVFSEQNAYLTRSIAMEPTKSGGTATYCAITGMETCAKTGSTDDYVDRWLCGMTPYYTAACWWGFDKEQEPLTYQNGTVYSVDGRNPAGQLWSTIMKSIHKELPNKTFNKPNTGIVTATICKTTGCVATASCGSNTYTEVFSSDNLPSKCEGHGTQKICKETGKIANEYCTDVEERVYGGIIPKEKLGLWTPISTPSKIGTEEVTEVCDVHKKTEEKPKNDTVENTTVTEKPTGNATENTIANETANTTTNTVENTTETNNSTIENETSENKVNENKTTN